MHGTYVYIHMCNSMVVDVVVVVVVAATVQTVAQVSWSFLTGLGPQPFFARGPYQALSPNIKGWSHFAPCAPFAERLNCRVPIPGPQPLSKT